MKPDERALLIAVAARPKPRHIGLLFPGVAGTNLESVRAIGARMGIHPKRIVYLCHKWSSRGWYDWGCSPDIGWLTEEGLAKAAEINTGSSQ